MAALLRGKAGVSQLLLCLLPKQSTWHQHAARQAIWLRLLLDDLQLGLGNKPFPIMNDNAGTIALSKNPVHHERSKHIGGAIISSASESKTIRSVFLMSPQQTTLRIYSPKDCLVSYLTACVICLA